jgi:hypothetical protein
LTTDERGRSFVHFAFWKLKNLNLIELFDELKLLFKILFAEFMLEFQTKNEEIEKFLDPKVNQASNILHITTEKSETKFLYMQIQSLMSTADEISTPYIMLKTSLSEKEFENGMKAFVGDRLLVIEVDSEDICFGKYKEQLIEMSQKSSRRLIVISEVSSKIQFENYPILKYFAPHLYPKDLTKDSLIKVLNSEVTFQNYPITWKELLSENYIKNEVLLADLVDTKLIAENVPVAKEYNKKLYVNRTFSYANTLSPEVLKACFDEFVYNEEDFQAKLETNSGRNVHWLERDDDFLR